MREEPVSSSFDTDRFVSLEAQKIYKASLSKPRLVIVEVNFQPSATCGDIRRQITTLGWENYVGKIGVANLTLVREFYANLRASDTTGYQAMVRGKEVVFSSDVINEFLGVTRSSPCEYSALMDRGPNWMEMLQSLSHPDAEWNYSVTVPDQPTNLVMSACLNRFAIAWCKFLRGNLNPTLNKNELTKDRVALLYCILTGVNINIGRIIARNIMSSAKGSLQLALVHPVLITLLCVRAEIPVYDSDLTRPQIVVDWAKIRQINELPGMVSRANGMGFDITPNVQSQPPPPPARRVRQRMGQRTVPTASSPQHDDDPGCEEVSIHSLGQMLQRISLRMDAFSAHQHLQESRQRRWEHRMEHRLTDLQERQRLYTEYTAQHNTSLADPNVQQPEFPVYLSQPYQPPDEDMD